MKTSHCLALVLILAMLAAPLRAEPPASGGISLTSQGASPASGSTASDTAPVINAVQNGAGSDPLANTRATLTQNINNAFDGKWNNTIYSQVVGQGAGAVWDSVRGVFIDVKNPTSMGSCVDAAGSRAQVLQQVLQNMSQNGQLPYNATVFSRSGYNFPIPFSGGEQGSAHTYNVIKLTDDTGRVVDNIEVDDYLGWTSVSSGQGPVDPKDFNTTTHGSVPASSKDPNAPYRGNTDPRANEPPGGVNVGSSTYVPGSQPGETPGMNTSLPGWAAGSGQGSSAPTGGSNPPMGPFLPPYMTGPGWSGGQPPFVGIGLPPFNPLTPVLPGGNCGGSGPNCPPKK
jgi:hypothetical protein